VGWPLWPLFKKLIYMDMINGVPLRWDALQDNALLGGLGLNGSIFPENTREQGGPSMNNAAANLDSYFEDSLFGNFNLREGGEGIDDGNTTYITYRAFDSEEQMNRFFIGSGTHSNGSTITRILSGNTFSMACCYISNGDHLDNSIVIRANGPVGAKLAALSITDLREKLNFYADKVIEFGKKYEGFYFKKPAIVEALEDAVPSTYNKLRSLKGIAGEKGKLYEANYEFFSAMTENFSDPATEQAVRRLCALLTRLDYDVVETYGQQTDVRYATGKLQKTGKKIPLASILSMIRRLQKTAATIKYFQNNNFNNQDEVIAYVNNNFTDNSAIGAETHFVINFPFKKLGYERRKKMVQLFLRGSDLEFSGFFAGAHFDGHRDISAGDIVYNLFITASEKDRLKLVQDLDNGDHDLFYLLNGSSGDCFMTLSFIVGCAILGTLDSEKKMGEVMNASMKEKNTFFFNDESGKNQTYGYDEENKLIKFENKGHSYSSTNPPVLYRSTWRDMEKQKEKIKAAEKAFAKKEEEYISTYASQKTLFRPLDFIVLTAESDIKSDVLKMLFANIKDEAGEAYSGLKKDDMVILPACIVYLLFKEYHEKSKAYAILAATTLLFLPFGIGALVGAIEAANAIGIIVAITDVTLDVTVLAVNDPKAIENNKERAEFVNTLAFFWGLARLTYAMKDAPEIIGKANKKLIAALDQLVSIRKRSIEWLKNLFCYNSEAEALFREIFKLIDKGMLSEYQFAKIAKRIKAKTGVDMHLVDATAPKFKELYKKWKEEPVYAVFHSSKFKNGRYGVVLDGPAIYFFRGGDVKLTSYTVQHELFHVKLWYTLVKRNGVKGGQLIYGHL
jgi:hypothetical protein